MFLDQTINNSGERMIFGVDGFLLFFGIWVVGKCAFNFLALDLSCRLWCFGYRVVPLKIQGNGRTDERYFS